jgi:S1-C subfamily serine protease
MDAGVVRVEAQVGGKRRAGSGFVVRVEGDAAYVATAAHVVEGDPAPRVYFQPRPHRAAEARVLAQEGGDPRGLVLLLVESGAPAEVEALPMADGGGFDLVGGEAVSAGNRVRPLF